MYNAAHPWPGAISRSTSLLRTDTDSPLPLPLSLHPPSVHTCSSADPLDALHGHITDSYTLSATNVHEGASVLMWHHGAKADPPTSVSVEGLGDDGGSSKSSAAPAITSASRKWPLRSLFSARGGSVSASGADMVYQYQLHKKNDTADSEGCSGVITIEKGVEAQGHEQQQHAHALLMGQRSNHPHMSGGKQVRQRHGVLTGLGHPCVSDTSPLARGVCADVEYGCDGDDSGNPASVLEQHTLPDLSAVNAPSASATVQAADSDDIFISDVALAHPRPPRALQQASAFTSVTSSLAPPPHKSMSQTTSLAAHTPAPVGFHSGIQGLRSAHDTSRGEACGKQTERASADLKKRRKKGLGAVSLLPPTSLSAVPSASAHPLLNDEPVATALTVPEAERQRREAEEAEAAAQRQSWLHAAQELLEQIAGACEADVLTLAEAKGNVVYPDATVTDPIHAARQLLEKASSREVSSANSLDSDSDAVRTYGAVVRMLAAHTQTAAEEEGGACETDCDRSRQARQRVLETWRSISEALPSIWRQAWASATATFSEEKQPSRVRSFTAVIRREPTTPAQQVAVALSTAFMQSALHSDRPLGVRNVHADVVAALEAALESSATAILPIAPTVPLSSEMPPWAIEIVAATAEAVRSRDEMIKQHVADVASTVAAVDHDEKTDRAMRRAWEQLREGSWMLWYVLRVLGLLAWWEGIRPHLIPYRTPSPQAHTPMVGTREP